MITRINPSFAKMIHNIGRIPGLHFIFGRIWHSFIEKTRKNRIEDFQKKALGVLYDFDKTMTENGFVYSVFAGTLLGAVREKGFIKHDIDIDTVMFVDKFSNSVESKLIENGFVKKHYFAVNEGKLGKEITFEKNGIGIDIFMIYADKEGNTIQCDFQYMPGCYSFKESMSKYGHVKVRRLDFPVSRAVIRAPFETISVNILENADEWLSLRYGIDYMTPNPDFRDNGTNPHIKNWDNVIATWHKP